MTQIESTKAPITHESIPVLNNVLYAVVKNFDTTYLIPKNRVGEFYDNVDCWYHFRRNGLFDKIWGGFQLSR